MKMLMMFSSFTILALFPQRSFAEMSCPVFPDGKPNEDTLNRKAKELSDYIQKEVPIEARESKAGKIDINKMVSIEYCIGMEEALIEKGCDKQHNKSICARKQNHKKMYEMAMKIHDEQEVFQAKEGSDGAFLLACKIKGEMAYFESVIQKEKDGAKESGVVDTNLMYKMGQEVAAYKKKLKPHEDTYLKANGQPIDYTKCGEK